MKTTGEEAGLTVASAELEWVPNTMASVDDQEKEEKVYTFLERLDELDDIQNVYANIG